MPMFRAGSKLVYFAHVPKCAGSSMLHYLRDRFGTVAFHDGKFHFVPDAARWSRTSPQHVDAQTLERMFPNGFFDASFAIVRHPVSRLFSAFHFQREVERLVPMGMTFGAWIEKTAAERIDSPFIYDNHTRPMDEIVPAGAATFQLEAGFAPLIIWLDELTGDAKGPRSLPKVNERGGSGRQKVDMTTPTPADIKLIAKIYSRDFERFGYEPETFGRGAPSPPDDEKPKQQQPIKGILRALGLS